MKKHIQKLKEKPDHHKQKIAHTMAIIVTAIIVIVWIIIRIVVPEQESNTPEEKNSFSISNTLESIFTTTSSELADIQEEFNDQPTFEELLQQTQQESDLEENTENNPDLNELEQESNGTRTETTTE